jgi:ribulose 1,5-bisphosphate synthetase/thiazole synthase
MNQRKSEPTPYKVVRQFAHVRVRARVMPIAMLAARRTRISFRLEWEHSDILVVGAGSAGAAMAARLSEEPTLRVTVVARAGAIAAGKREVF